MRTAAYCILFLLVSVISGCATKRAVIQGQLQVPVDKAGTRSNAKPNAAVTGNLADAVIYIDPVPQKLASKLPRSPVARIVQTKGRFVPHVLPVAIGTRVDFENRDGVFHNTFSVSRTKRFDLGKYAPRQVRSVTFDRVGIVNLFCDIHPSMSALVMVLPHGAFAQPDATGSFTLPSLPEGAYTVTAWHPRFGEKKRRIRVPKSGKVSVPLSF